MVDMLYTLATVLVWLFFIAGCIVLCSFVLMTSSLRGAGRGSCGTITDSEGCKRTVIRVFKENGALYLELGIKQYPDGESKTKSYTGDGSNGEIVEWAGQEISVSL